eukprot:6357844-Pyramimonas_sp.AAC.1
MRPPPLRTFSRGTIGICLGSSTEGPSGCDHVRPAPPSTAFRGPKAPPKSPMAVITCAPGHP